MSDSKEKSVKNEKSDEPSEKPSEDEIQPVKIDSIKLKIESQLDCSKFK